MNKIAILTDTHFGAGNGNKITALYISRFFNDVFFPYLKANNIKTVIHAGDFVDNRTTISYLTLNQIERDFITPVIENDIDVHVLMGNHDVYYRNSNDISSSFIFPKCKNIKTYSSIEDVELLDKQFTMCPWINNSNYESTLTHISNSSARVLIGHLEVKDALMMKNKKNEHGIDSSEFIKYDVVISGHFHHRNSLGNIHYIGNPYPLNWGDYNEPRGFCVLDVDSNELEYIDNEYSQYQKIYYDDSLYDYSNITFDCNNKYIKIIVVKKTDQKLFDRFITAINLSGAYQISIVDSDIELSDAPVDEHELESYSSLDLMYSTLKSLNISDDIKNECRTLLTELYKESTDTGSQ